MNTNLSKFQEGIKDGIPIALGYLAVSFSLGIAMRNAGVSALQGFVMSFVNLASAGEYAGIQVLASNSGYLQMALITLIANARYFLMSCSFTQKFSKETPLYQKLLCGYSITDELFGIGIAQKGFLNPWYFYGGMAIAIPAWAIGSALGVIAGNILPAEIVTALSVSLYGMFIAIIIPASKKDKAVLLVVLISFLFRYLTKYIPLLNTLSEGQIVIIGTLLIASFSAILKPIKDEEAAHE